MPPRPWSIRIVGNGPSPVAGSVTSTSSGVPSKLATRDARSVVGQKRTPSFGAHAWPNGAGAAWAVPGASTARAATAAASAAERRAEGIRATYPGGPATAPPPLAALLGRASRPAPCPVRPSVIVLVDVDDFDTVLAGEAAASA